MSCVVNMQICIYKPVCCGGQSSVILRPWPPRRTGLWYESVCPQFKVNTRDVGCRYLGGFLGEKSKQDEWIVEEKLNFWIGAVDKFAMVARKHPQSAYAIYTKCLQMEWQYLQRVVKDLSHRETCSSNPRSQESRDTLRSRANGWLVGLTRSGAAGISRYYGRASPRHPPVST